MDFNVFKKEVSLLNLLNFHLKSVRNRKKIMFLFVELEINLIFNILRFYVNYTVIARIGFAMWGFLSLWIPSIDYMKCTTSLFYVFYGNKQYETLSFFKPGFTRFLLYVRIRGKSKAEGKPWRSDKVTQILAISV